MKCFKLVYTNIQTWAKFARDQADKGDGGECFIDAAITIAFIVLAPIYLPIMFSVELFGMVLCSVLKRRG